MRNPDSNFCLFSFCIIYSVPFTSTKKFSKSNCRSFPIHPFSPTNLTPFIKLFPYTTLFRSTFAHFRSALSMGTLLHLRKKSAKVTVGIPHYALVRQQIALFSSNCSFYEKSRQ